MYTEQLSQCLGVVGFVLPSSAASGSAAAGQTTQAIDISKVRRVLFVLSQGALAANGGVQVQVEGATASGGTYTVITSLTSAFLTASGVALVEATMEGVVSLNSGYTWLKGTVNSSGGTSSGTTLIALAGVARNEPASGLNLTTVATPIVF